VSVSFSFSKRSRRIATFLTHQLLYCDALNRAAGDIDNDNNDNNGDNNDDDNGDGAGGKRKSKSSGGGVGNNGIISPMATGVAVIVLALRCADETTAATAALAAVSPQLVSYAAVAVAVRHIRLDATATIAAALRPAGIRLTRCTEAVFWKRGGDGVDPGFGGGRGGSGSGSGSSGSIVSGSGSGSSRSSGGSGGGGSVNTVARALTISHYTVIANKLAEELERMHAAALERKDA
jgi:hypothetical protein